MAQLYSCTLANGVWVVPGSDRIGRIDIKAKGIVGGERVYDEEHIRTRSRTIGYAVDAQR